MLYRWKKDKNWLTSISSWTFNSLRKKFTLKKRLSSPRIATRKRRVQRKRTKERMSRWRSNPIKRKCISFSIFRKKVNNCGHTDKPHYAKGMCNNCYHRCGRDKKPWKCQHEKLYAAGLCQNCYINDYNRKKRLELGQNEATKNIS